LEHQLKPDQLQRIEVTNDGQTVVFERGPTGEWTLPGHWPARAAEIGRLVGTLTSLQSRFAPIPLANSADLAPHGLTNPPVTVQEKKSAPTHFTLAKTGDDWQLQEPVHDSPDPDKLKALLTAVPDIWAEKFVENPDKDLTKYGLKEPEQTIQVTKSNGEAMTLL